MAEQSANNSSRRMTVRHRGRGAQVWIYLGKQLRMFIYQSDWKVLPMAALIAGLVGMVIRKKFFLNFEGTIMGAFAMVCVCIWNGCFNSIQVICRERDVIKREHRSGMHISSYIFSHMLYQALLCLLQTGVTLYVTMKTGVRYDLATPMITKWFIVDIGISMFLITYASDMLSLWISTLARTTTTAMTIMPFVLIFQLVFSGGMLTLPEWTKGLTPFTISNPGLKVIATQADTNNRPYVTIADMIGKMKESPVEGVFTVGQILDMLDDEDNPTVAELRAREIGSIVTVGEIREMLMNADSFAELREQKIDDDMTFGDALVMLDSSKAFDQYNDQVIDATTTIGALVDWLSTNGDVQSRREQQITVTTTVGDVVDLIGEQEVKTFLEEKAAAANYKSDYEYNVDSIINYWLHLLAFVLGFAMLATITLEFIDKDKR